MNFNFLNFIYNYSLNFQEPGSSYMFSIIILHGHLCWTLTFIGFFVLFFYIRLNFLWLRFF